MSSTDYVQITKDEFDEFVADELPREFEEKEWNWTQEAVYDCELPRGEHTFVLRIWSSVDVRDGYGRKKGGDAIRVQCLVVDEDKGPGSWKPIVHHSQLPDDCGSHIKRTDGWKDRVKRHLIALESIVGGEQYQECIWCDRPMIVRTNKSTGDEFFGCSGFPDCRHTEAING
ncbi:topoisomerase DNA-binding C4 zinc finger domain-containing protein (plasmid) [Halorarum halophilum]|uniref:Topoisomerase DNA-binding C4 zinc finger domain-containing protein n=1 Tax=Halorarum halophilum TaxID=2743090 RepID=A0A7D5GES2_9EURY|nr:topoisomerase DNA-binding C4 zinc finger domain-containing protein [Halobaculum halophilum]QLG30025.1 topoisomerase DNA-binding C4 zinc finger domain-containing protein [Halobaculum halophilum]